MLVCACSLPACTVEQSSSLLICAHKNATLLRPRRAFILAIVCIMFISWLLLLYAAGFESFLVEYHFDRGQEVQHARKLLTEFEQKSAANVPKFWIRKFLREGTDSADHGSKKESNPELLNHNLQEGTFSGGNYSTIPGRRSLIPATNMCTNKDISISQGPDGSSGIPRYFVQIVNTCMSDCAPSQVHVFCGWFASAVLVNPSTFQRLAYNDCLVNGGNPLKYGEILNYWLLSVSTNSEFTSKFRPLYIIQSRTDQLRELWWWDASNECTNKDISITQRRDGSPGIPRFNVQIVNTCLSDCAPADIHVYCGWFASSPPPNPNTFQRVSYNDCLVNGGRPLGQGAIIQFQYANSFMYPIQFRSARFCR